MFDYFREIVREAGGFDSQATGNKLENKMTVDKRSESIFSKKAKIIISIFAALYIFISVSTIVAISGMSNISHLIFKNVLMSVLALGTIVSFTINKRNSDRTAIICIALFTLMLVSSNVFLFGQ